MSGSQEIAIVTSIHQDYDKRIWRHAKGLASRGHKVKLICPWSVPHGTDVEGVRFLTFPRSTGIVSRLLMTPIRVLNQIRRHCKRSDILHFHDPDLLPWMALLSRSRTTVYDVHENYPEEVRRRLSPTWLPAEVIASLIRKLQRFFAGRIRNIVLVADSQRGDLLGGGVAYCFVRNYASRLLLAQVRSDYNHREPIVGFVGRQHENNGSFLLLEIARICSEREVGVTFLAPDLFRKDGDRARFLERIRTYGLEGQVKLFEPVRAHEIMRVLNRCKIAINPNLRVTQQINGIHTKMYEFMAAGLPIIASDLPHQKQLIEEAGCGFAVPPEEPAKFVEKIDYLLRHEEYAESLGRSGSEAFKKKYSWESQLDVLCEFYQTITVRHPSAEFPG